MAFQGEQSDPRIKQEPLYNSMESASPATMPSESPSLKRRRSDESQDLGEKRQRVEPVSSMDRQAGNLISEEFQAALAKAAGATMQQHAPSSSALHLYEEGGSHHVAAPQEHTEHEDQNSGFTSDPHLYMRILSLPILESLSTQILSTLSQGKWHATLKVMQSPESELGQAYATLKSLFDQTKQIYSQKDAFLSADELNIHEPKHRATIQITNLATFIAAIFIGSLGFYELNDHFIEAFTPDGEPLSKEAGDLFISLKTQMFLSAVTQEEPERTKEDNLDDLFPIGFDEFLIARHPNSALAEGEDEFLQALHDRRDYLMNDVNDIDSIQEISAKFPWEDFLQSLCDHLSKTYRPLITPYMKRHALTAPASPVRGLLQNATHSTDSLNPEFEGYLQRATQLTLNEFTPRSADDHSQNHEGSSSPQQSSHDATQDAFFDAASTKPPHSSQPTSTLEQYKRARKAAATKTSTDPTQKPGMASTRRPWTDVEENALLDGLDKVEGPHWSQILALYGKGGSLGEQLKDRNQVQLKDKARNLKLFFLKNTAKVPIHLQAVTGDLKTRAPTQAQRKENEAKQKANAIEEQNRFDGIMVLGRGLKDHEHTTPPTVSPARDESPLQVVEPASQDHLNVLQPEDEHLRQSLMAASSVSERPRAAPTASMV
ncbi:hypothetical protein N431DRAFT_432577 [Stipitochalara longipes BDJ]|nr:hypothetical protein N431DRAFT_432577 [Stipitochalara longipes BDJ]